MKEQHDESENEMERYEVRFNKRAIPQRARAWQERLKSGHTSNYCLR